MSISKGCAISCSTAFQAGRLRDEGEFKEMLGEAEKRLCLVSVDAGSAAWWFDGR